MTRCPKGYRSETVGNPLGHIATALKHSLRIVEGAIAATMAANIHHGLDTSSVSFALSYIAFRGVLICQYLHAGYHVPQARALTNWYAIGFGLSIIFWLGSMLVAIPWRFVMWGLGLLIDFATPLTAGKRVVNVPPDMAHTTERIGLFTIIVLGESIVAVVGGVSERAWTPVSIAIALLGLSIAFSFWWMYFDTVSPGYATGRNENCSYLAIFPSPLSYWLDCNGGRSRKNDSWTSP